MLTDREDARLPPGRVQYWLLSRTGPAGLPAELVTDGHTVLHKGACIFYLFIYFCKMGEEKDLKMCRHCAVIKCLAWSESHILRK